jgi:hypothetical protein
MAQKDIVEVSIYYRRKWHVSDRTFGIYQNTSSLQHECENITKSKAWHVCGNDLEWHTNWFRLMQPRRNVKLSPSSIDYL